MLITKLLPAILLANLIYCEQNVIQINLMKPPNSFSDKFVSYSIDSQQILEGLIAMIKNNNAPQQIPLTYLAPAYIKVNFSPTLHDDETLKEVENTKNDFKFDFEKMKKLNEWMNANGFTMIVQLDYDVETWRSRDALKLLGVANDYGISNCVWQLGSAINSTSIAKYMQDFNTFTTLLDVFPEKKSSWSTLPAAIGNYLTLNEIKLVTNSLKTSPVAGVAWTESENQKETLDIVASVLPAPLRQTYQAILPDFRNDDSVRYLLTTSTHPVWFEPMSKPNSTFKRPLSTECGYTCITKAIEWAKQLGSSAKTGFDVVFQSLNKIDLIQPDFQHHVNSFFKRLVKQKFIENVSFKPTTDALDHYTFCSATKSGGVVFMVINSDLEIAKLQMRLPRSTQSAKNYHMLQYTLVGCDGNVCVNGREMPSNPYSAEPILKNIPNKHGVNVAVPPMSVSFFDVPNANVYDCNVDYNKYEVSKTKRESNEKSENSLEKLVLDIIETALQEVQVLTTGALHTSTKRRQKREVDLDKVFKTLKYMQDLVPTDLWDRIVPQNIRENINYFLPPSSQEEMKQFAEKKAAANLNRNLGTMRGDIETNSTDSRTENDQVNELITRMIMEQKAKKVDVANQAAAENKDDESAGQSFEKALISPVYGLKGDHGLTVTHEEPTVSQIIKAGSEISSNSIGSLEFASTTQMNNDLKLEIQNEEVSTTESTISAEVSTTETLPQVEEEIDFNTEEIRTSTPIYSFEKELEVKPDGFMDESQKISEDSVDVSNWDRPVPDSETFVENKENYEIVLRPGLKDEIKSARHREGRPRKIFTRSSRPLRQLPKLSDLFKPITPFELPKNLSNNIKLTAKSLLGNANKLPANQLKIGKFRIPGIEIKDSSVEARVFKSAENNDFPQGILSLPISKSGTDKQTPSDADYEYVNFDADEVKKSTNAKSDGIKATINTQKVSENPTLEYQLNPNSSETDVTFYDGPGGDYIDASALTGPNDRGDSGETELAARTLQTTKNMKYKVRSNAAKPTNVHYAVLVKGLEPTDQQNQKNLRKAHQKVASFQLGDGDIQDSYVDYSNEDTDDDSFFSSTETSDKTKRHMLEDVEDHLSETDQLKLNLKGDRLVAAFGKLLKKMERHLIDDLSDDLPVRARRQIESVHVPSRNTRKAPYVRKTKVLSKVKPVNIDDLPIAQLHGSRRVRSIIDSRDGLSLNDIRKIVQESEETLDDDDYGFEPNEIQASVGRPGYEGSYTLGNYEPKISTYYKIEPNENQIVVSNETDESQNIVIDTKDTENDLSNEIISNEIIPFDPSVDPSDESVVETNNTDRPIRPVKLYDSFIKPMVDMFEQLKSNSKEFFKLVF